MLATMFEYDVEINVYVNEDPPVLQIKSSLNQIGSNKMNEIRKNGIVKMLKLPIF